MKLSSARVVDPILTSIALGFSNPAFVGMNLFPFVPVSLRGGKVIEFNKDNFKTVDAVRAPGAATKRISVGFGSQDFVLIDLSLDAQVPREEVEEASKGPGVDLQKIAINDVQELLGRALEIEQAGIARNAANYAAANKVTLGGGARLNDAATNPLPIFETAKKAIRVRIGQNPNTIMMPPDVLSALRQNPFVQDQVKYTGSGAPTAAKVTLPMLEEYLGIAKIIVCESVVLNETTDDLDDIWGKDVVIAWVNPTATNNRQPNFGYTYRLKGYPIVEATYYEQSSKSWINGYTDSRQPKITMADAAYLIVTAVD